MSLTPITLSPGQSITISAGAAPPPPPPAAALLGLFCPGESQTVIAAAAASLGVTSVISDIYAYGTDWTELSSVPAGPMQETIAVGALTPAQATTIAMWLVANGFKDNYIRVMWEMNGTWYPWGTQAFSPATYISTFQAIRAAFMAVPGAAFRFVWNLSAGTIPPAPRTQFDTYPGDADVDVVGIDCYNGFNNYQNIPAILAFAQAHGKAIAFCEWGCGNGAGGAGQQDAGLFVSLIAGYIQNAANNCVFQVYFNNSTSVLTLYPDGVTAYKAAFA
jgi:hypothetical protein